jgi:serine/threonine-protein kinase RsbW
MKEGVKMSEKWLTGTEWSIPSEFGREKRISANIAKLSGTSSLFGDRLDDMITTVTEACLNALEHGNKLDGRLQVRVRVQVSDSRTVYRIFDCGSGFDYAQWEEKRLAAMVAGNKLQEDNPRGWGLKLILSLADRVRFGSEAGAFYTEIEFGNDK